MSVCAPTYMGWAGETWEGQARKATGLKKQGQNRKKKGSEGLIYCFGH